MKEENNSSDNQVITPVFGASNRPSGRPEFEGAKAPQPGEVSAALGSDSIPFSGIPTSSAGAAPVNKKATKLSRAQLVEIEAKLSARDHAVLQVIKKYRFLTSDQIGRLYLTDTENDAHSKNCRQPPTRPESRKLSKVFEQAHHTMLSPDTYKPAFPMQFHPPEHSAQKTAV